MKKNLIKNSTKLYLLILLSTMCIFIYQYHLYRVNVLAPSSDHIFNDELVMTQKPNIDGEMIGDEDIIMYDETLNDVVDLNHTKIVLFPDGDVIVVVGDDFAENQTNIIGEGQHVTTTESVEKFLLNSTTTTYANQKIFLNETIIFGIHILNNGNVENTTDDRHHKTNMVNDKKNVHEMVPLPPPLYIITPTYRRPEQLAEITRLGYTLKHISNLMWLVIEDAEKPTELVTKLLHKIGVPFEHLVAPMPNQYKAVKIKPRGVSNRNRGLQWLRENATEGVFYFGDDDNTYDIEIFEQMRYTKKVSMWPVGLIGKFGVSSPVVKNGTLRGFYDGWVGGRRYPVDMAGFAVSVKFLLDRPKATMPFKAGYEEDGFLKSLAPFNTTDIELLATNCSEILTWHTQTKKNSPAGALDINKYRDTNLIALRNILV